MVMLLQRAVEITVGQAGERSDGGPVTPKLIGINDLWDIVVAQESGQEGRCGVGVTVPLKQDVEYKPVLVDGPPQPMADAIHRRADLIQRPSGTPAGFPVRETSCRERSEFDEPFLERHVTDRLGRAGAAVPERLGHSGESGGTARSRAG